MINRLHIHRLAFAACSNKRRVQMRNRIIDSDWIVGTSGIAADIAKEPYPSVIGKQVRINHWGDRLAQINAIDE